MTQSFPFNSNFSLVWNFTYPENSKVINYIHYPQRNAFEIPRLDRQEIIGEENVANYLFTKRSNLGRTLSHPNIIHAWTSIQNLFIEKNLTPPRFFAEVTEKVVFFYPLGAIFQGMNTNVYEYAIYNPNDLPTLAHVLGAVDGFYRRKATDDDIKKVYPNLSINNLSAIKSYLGDDYSLIDVIRGLPIYDVSFTRIMPLLSFMNYPGFYIVELIKE